jgi:two-component system, NtrC family, nitrogen regulation sensor histidine kinase NtrY
VRILRRRSLERRLFAWLLVLALVPSLVLVVGGTWAARGSLEWTGAVAPWDRVAESGRALFEAAAPAASADPELAAALEQHRSELSGSLTLARRWAFLGDRLATALPWISGLLTLLVALLALIASRSVARVLSRPIADLHDWAARLGREEPLPPATDAERREVREVRALRAALRTASTELTAARQRTLEAERLRLWGEIARRVAHEMKNALTPLALAARRLQGGRGDAEAGAIVVEETRRLEELARQFAALGRLPEGPRSPVDLAELLGGLLAADVPPDADARLTAQPDLPHITGHYDSLLRAFRNLLRNAVEASDGPARIDVQLSAGAGDVVEVSVADRGRGLPPGAETLIFEPDFTTKSSGTGLGLALVRQAVSAHGGEVLARARDGGGAVITVRLPATPELQPANHRKGA